MNFRIARHTNDLKPIITFYRDILGLEVLGEFHDHNSYDGVFLGKNGLDWHLEFTTSDEPAEHTPDQDDLMVFYVDSAHEYNVLKQRFTDEGIKPVTPKNSYWLENGITFQDPDGFRIVLTIQQQQQQQQQQQ